MKTKEALITDLVEVLFELDNTNFNDMQEYVKKMLETKLVVLAEVLDDDLPTIWLDAIDKYL